MNILLISGSTRAKSHTKALVAAIAKSLEKKGAKVTHWDLFEKPLPPMDPITRDDVLNHPDNIANEFARLADKADALVWGSPLYHNSFSGVLKSAIDHLKNPQFAYKPIGLVSHGGGGSKQAVDQLRLVARAVNAVATPTIICTSEEDYQQKGKGYLISSKAIKDRIERFSGELMVMAKSMKKVRKEMTVKDK